MLKIVKNTPNNIVDILKDIGNITDYGFGSNVFGVKIPLFGERVFPRTVHTTYPDEWIKHYHKAKLWYNDPILQCARRINGWIKWDSFTEGFSGYSGSQKVFDLAQKYGIDRSTSSTFYLQFNGEISFISCINKALSEEEKALISGRVFHAHSLLSSGYAKKNVNLLTNDWKILEAFSTNETIDLAARSVGMGKSNFCLELKKIRHAYGLKNNDELKKFFNTNFSITRSNQQAKIHTDINPVTNEIGTGFHINSE